MEHKRQSVLCLGAVYLSITMFAFAVIPNSSFEEFETPDPPIGFNPPVGWEHNNYTAVLDNFIPEPGREGYVTNWKIDTDAGLPPFDGNYLVVLSTGSIIPDPDYAKIWTQIEVFAGETLSGFYFFGTCDYESYNDYATIRLMPQDPNSNDPINLVAVGLNSTSIPDHDTYLEECSVGTFGSMEGWQGFECLFTEDTAGIYDLTFHVKDSTDKLFKSYLAVDHLKLCAKPQYGDLNYDCNVNMFDFATLAEAWLCDCSDTGNMPDPNDCPWSTVEGGGIEIDLIGDIDGDNVVDPNDIRLMAENWLWLPPE